MDKLLKRLRAEERLRFSGEKINKELFEEKGNGNVEIIDAYKELIIKGRRSNVNKAINLKKAIVSLSTALVLVVIYINL